MSNVFTNSDFAVLSVMDTVDDNNNEWTGSTVFIQRKPEADYGNITLLSFIPDGVTKRKDFNVQARFEANIVPKISSELSEMSVANVTLSNSNISVSSYRLDGTVIT